MSSIYFMEKERNMVNHLNYYYFTNVFTPEELEKIKKLGDSIPKRKAETGAGEHGTVSDFRKSDINFTTKQIKKISDRKNIGCDQLIIIRSPKNPIFF